MIHASTNINFYCVCVCMWVYRHWTQWKCHANPWFTLIVFILTNSHNNCSSSNKSVFKLWINVYQMVCLYVLGMNANWNDYVIGIRLWWPTVKRTLSLRLSSMLIKWFMANLYVCVCVCMICSQPLPCKCLPSPNSMYRNKPHKYRTLHWYDLIAGSWVYCVVSLYFRE